MTYDLVSTGGEHADKIENKDNTRLSTERDYVPGYHDAH